MNRRSFLSRLLPAVAATIVVPSLTETLAVSSKKYFFIRRPWPPLRGPYHRFVYDSMLHFDRHQLDLNSEQLFSVSSSMLQDTLLQFQRNLDAVCKEGSTSILTL